MNAQKETNDEESSNDGVVQHHEIGELAHFLTAFGKNKEEAAKTIAASSLQVLGLEEIQQKYADRWHLLEKRVDFAVEAFFSKKLSKKDLFVRLETGSYALIFADTTKEKGLEKSEKYATDLLELLFGQVPEVEQVTIEASAMDVDLSEVMDDFQNIEELIEYLQGFNCETREEDEEQFKESSEDIVVCFRPMINQTKKIMSVIEAMPCRKDGDQFKEIPLTDPLLQGTSDLRAELDIMVLEQAKPAVETLGSMKNKPLLMVSVDFETIAHAYRRLRYAQALKRLPAYTQKHLIVNILGVEPGLLNSRLRQILTTLNPLVLGFTFGVGPEWNDFDKITDLPVYGLSVVGGQEQDLIWIEQLVQKTRDRGLRVCWRNMESDDLARQAFSYGVNYVSGPVIGRCNEDPIAPFSLKQAL